MEEELSLDNIMSEEEVENLFNSEEIQEEEVKPLEEKNKEENEENKEKKLNKTATEEINTDDLFEESPEGVGSEEKVKEESEDASLKGNGASPNFYSSIAKALKEEGIFPDLNDEGLSKVKEPEDFRDLIEQQIKAGLDERQRKIDEALNVGVEPTEIKKYENTLNYLESIKDDSISDESDKGEELRKNLIFQDFINRGYSKERATREVQKSFNAGTDIEDAKEALTSNKEFFNNKYDTLIDNARLAAEQEENERKEQMEKLKTSLLQDKEVFGDLSVDKSTRQKMYDNITKPIYKNPDTGEYYTAIQKYELDNRTDFLKNVGILFTLTDGFKNLDKLIKGKVKKEVKQGLKNLESVLNNTARTSDGNLKYISSVNEDPESFIEKGWKLDV